MKDIIIFVLCLTPVIVCKAQTSNSNIKPLEDLVEMDYAEIEEDTCFKDIHGVLDEYKGSWTGEKERKDYKVVLTKTTKTTKIGPSKTIKEDELLLRYKINENRNNIISTLSLSDDDGLVNPGFRIEDKGDHLDYYFVYGGKKIKCGQSGDILLRTTADPDKIKLRLYPDREIIIEQDCPDGEADQVFPTEDWLILHRKKN